MLAKCSSEMTENDMELARRYFFVAAIEACAPCRVYPVLQERQAPFMPMRESSPPAPPCL